MSESEVFFLQILALALGGVLAASGLLVFCYVRALSDGREGEPLSADPPQIEVWMPVRNGGPELRSSLESLLQMDYPNFFVRVVIDNAADPAVPIVEEMQRDDCRLRYEILNKEATSRSLFNSSLVQFFDHLDARSELLVSCCADMNLPRNYYRNQAAAMSDESVGCTLGNRWYCPRSDSWGSIFRYLYNVGAVAPMWLFNIPWGGAIALRPDDVRAAGLLEAWQSGMVDDAPIPSALKRIGKRFVFVPQLLVFEDEPISIAACFNFLERQLMWTRLYNPQWPVVVVSVLGLFLLCVLPWSVAAATAIAGRYDVTACVIVIFVCFWMGVGLLLSALEIAARRVIKANGQFVPKWTPSITARVILAIPAAFSFFLAALLKVSFAKYITWSNVTYDVGRPFDIRIVGDRNGATAAVLTNELSL